MAGYLATLLVVVEADVEDEGEDGEQQGGVQHQQQAHHVAPGPGTGAPGLLWSRGQAHLVQGEWKTIL